MHTYFKLRSFSLQKKIFFEKITKITDDMRKSLEDAYDFLEKFLVGNQYVAGNDVTIADFSVITSLTNSSVST